MQQIYRRRPKPKIHILFLREPIPLRGKCPNTEFFLARIFLYSVRVQENTDQKKTSYLDTFHTVFVIQEVSEHNNITPKLLKKRPGNY